jgi:hypothetical protein
MVVNSSTTPPKSSTHNNTSPFTRSHDHKKNDNCFVEQKNGAIVREYIGYDRLAGFQKQTFLARRLYPPGSLLNFFMPTQKLISKTRVGSKEINVYDEPESPFQRLMENGELPQEYKGTFTGNAPFQPGGTSIEWQQGYPAPVPAACPNKPCTDPGAGIATVTFQNEAFRPFTANGLRDRRFPPAPRPFA